MESLLRILLFLCLSSLATNLKIPSPIKLNSKNIDLNILRKPSNHNHRSGITSNQHLDEKQCFCITKNTDSKLVTDHLVTQDQDIERLVVYLYRVNGLLRAFIPNKQKQVMIPDLTFDKDQGDVIKGVLLEPVVDLFGSGPIITEVYPEKPVTNAPGFKPSEQFGQTVEPIQTDNDFIHIPTNNVDLPDILHMTELAPLTDVDIPAPSLDLSENTPLLIPDIHEANNTDDLPILDKIENAFIEPIAPTAPTQTPNPDPFKPPQSQLSNGDSSSNGLSVPVEIQNPINPSSGSLSNIPEPSLPSKQDIPNDVQEILNLKDSLYDKPTVEKIKIIIEIINSSLHAIENNSEGKYDRLRQMIYILPPDAIAYVKSQFPHLLMEYPGDSMESHFITFDNWLKEQLRRIFSQKLEITYVNKLRNRILSILNKNGMYFATNGNLHDSDGNLIKISNIRLRVILIGDLIEYEKMVNNDETYKFPGARLPYHQLILIFLVKPTRALGILPIGKVYLPRNFEGGPDLKNFDWRSGRPLRHAKPSCMSKSCMFSKNKWSLPPYSHGPLSRNFNPEEVDVRHLPAQIEDFNINPQPDSRAGNIVQVLLKLLDSSDVVDPSRRVLGGKYLKDDKPSPGTLPNDDLPGIRIVGGNPAISSGTPLVSKGRSVFNDFNIYPN